MKRLLVFFIFLAYQPVFSQNLVPNGDFENISNPVCGIYGHGDLASVTGNWQDANNGSADIITTLVTSSCETNALSYFSYWGAKTPHGGNSYLALITYCSTCASETREYPEALLTQPMVAGQTYLVDFWVCAAHNVEWCTNNLGVYFSTSQVNSASWLHLPYTPQVVFSQVLSDSVNWVHLSQTFVAADNYTYIIIGNFSDDFSTTLVENTASSLSYGVYYIDDIEVRSQSGTPPTADFTPNDVSECKGACITYNNLSANATSYSWLFPGGNPATSSDINPTICYANAGKYDVRLIATNSFGSDTSMFVNNVTINSSPVAGTLTSSKDSICEGTGITSKLKLSDSSAAIVWQSSLDGIHFSAIPGDATGTYVTPRALDTTTYYREVVNNNCGSASTNVVVVHILPAPFVDFDYTLNGKQVSFHVDNVSANVISYHWDFGDNQTSEEINPVHTFDSLKTYYVCLTVYNGSNCSYTFCKYVDLLTGIDNINASLSFQVYPNPANITINLAVSGLHGNYQLKIYNVLGQQVKAMNGLQLRDNENISVDLSDLVYGTYQLVLISNKGYNCNTFVHLK